MLKETKKIELQFTLDQRKLVNWALLTLHDGSHEITLTVLVMMTKKFTRTGVLPIMIFRAKQLSLHCGVPEAYLTLESFENKILENEFMFKPWKVLKIKF